MASLEGNGYVTRLRDGGYDLGPAAFRLGIAYERRNGLRGHVMPVLQDLVERGTESSSFHVRQDAGHRLCLFRVDSAPCDARQGGGGRCLSHTGRRRRACPAGLRR